jgi:hypothetical protein
LFRFPLAPVCGFTELPPDRPLFIALSLDNLSSDRFEQTMVLDGIWILAIHAYPLRLRNFSIFLWLRYSYIRLAIAIADLIQ